MKKKFIKATIQLVIWLILLGIVWYYSSLSPDRQRTFLNQFNVLITQIKILYYKLIWQWQAASQKVNFEMSFDSLIKLWKNSGCLTWKQLDKALNVLDEIKSLSPKQFEKNILKYQEIYLYYQQYIKSKCPSVNFYSNK